MRVVPEGTAAWGPPTPGPAGRACRALRAAPPTSRHVPVPASAAALHTASALSGTPSALTTSIATVRDECYPVPLWPVTLPIALLVAAGQGLPSTTLVYANVVNAVPLCATQSASRICPGMSWQHLHQPVWPERCNTSLAGKHQP